jgi:hypothetical protein
MEGISSDEATAIFAQLSQTPSSVTDHVLAILEKFVIILYDRTSADVKVNDARRHLFASKGRAIENQPSTHRLLFYNTHGELSTRQDIVGVSVW